MILKILIKKNNFDKDDYYKCNLKACIANCIKNICWHWFISRRKASTYHVADNQTTYLKKWKLISSNLKHLKKGHCYVQWLNYLANIIYQTNYNISTTKARRIILQKDDYYDKLDILYHFVVPIFKKRWKKWPKIHLWNQYRSQYNRWFCKICRLRVTVKY